jgi:hypothetical protein
MLWSLSFFLTCPFGMENTGSKGRHANDLNTFVFAAVLYRNSYTNEDNTETYSSRKIDVCTGTFTFCIKVTP